MSRMQDSFLTDPGLLAEAFLHANYMWEPPSGKIKEADYTLRCWSGDFYVWYAGRYLRFSDGEMRRLITRHLSYLNERSLQPDGSDHIRITSGLVNNILLCVSGTEGVHIPEYRELNSWDDARQAVGCRTISFRNTLLMLFGRSAGAFAEQHKPSYFSLVQLPCCSSGPGIC